MELYETKKIYDVCLSVTPFVCPLVTLSIFLTVIQYGIWDELDDLGFDDDLMTRNRSDAMLFPLLAETWVKHGSSGQGIQVFGVFPNSWCMISKPHQNINIVYLDFSYKSIIWSGWTWRSITTFLCFPLSTFFWKCPSSTFTFKKCLSPLSLSQVQPSYKVSQAGQYHLDLPFSTESILLRQQGFGQSKLLHLSC